MSTQPLAPSVTISPAIEHRSLPAAYLELAKARLVSLVVASTVIGFVMGSGTMLDWGALFWTALGTALAAGGANALNQCWEHRRDALMRRTRHRPIPAGQIPLREAVRAGLVLSVLGPVLLWFTTNSLAAGLAGLNVLIYVLIYTPLKTRTTLNTLVGGVCGALPPMLGWAAAAGELPLGAWILGLLLFIWQIPHFLALAWRYRDEYTTAGYRMLSRVDDTGELTGRVMLLAALSLVPVGLMSALAGLGGLLLADGALLLGLGLSLLVLRFLVERSDDAAKRVFFGSLVYLPAFFVILLVDHFV